MRLSSLSLQQTSPQGEESNPAPPIQRNTRSFLFTFSSIIVPPLLLIVVLIWHYGSLSALAAHNSGQLLYSEEPIRQLNVEPDSIAKIAFRVRNLSWSTVNVEVASVSCSCVHSPSLPLTVAPGKCGDVEFLLDVGSRSGRYQLVEEVSLYSFPAGRPCQLKIIADVNATSN